MLIFLRNDRQEPFGKSSAEAGSALPGRIPPWKQTGLVAKGAYLGRQFPSTGSSNSGTALRDRRLFAVTWRPHFMVTTEGSLPNTS